MENVDCALCGAGSSQAAPYQDVADRFTRQRFTLVKCRACGLVYLNPRPSVDEIGQYYPQDYEPYHLPSPAAAGNVEKLGVDELRALELQAGYVERFQPGRGRLLDVGCASGRFLNAARQRGWQVQGVELSEAAAQAARSRFHLDVFTGALEQADFAPQSFDAITLWDVLEHLPSPVATLQLCWRLLKPGGVLALSIPNLRSFDRQLFGTNWIGWDTPRHFTLFEQETLARALETPRFHRLDQRCLLGGKGTFILSMEILLGQAAPGVRRFVQPLLPLMGVLTFPYRRLSYLFRRGPILYVAARRRELA